MNWTLSSLAELPQVAGEFLQALGNRRVVAFQGKMGAGKTTFIKALCEQLGVCDMVNSPTFSIVNEYTDAEGQTLAYHFDLYRLKSVAEALDMGAEDYFYSGHYCFIEWPDVADALLPDNCAEASIEEADNGTRILTLR
ncbi:MAG: tRNA (adenosine(37)-N6)-threonylcarbamoyltransferase complex ATPase subunit type 1 TsaE [Bacteroidales bacterium]|nr:tRNA (adenosine(37)-N6)-threonylcarbamoyltransferase complex ATPase subunit type 1 TsaE [Bacteroidales bacterium]